MLKHLGFVVGAVICCTPAWALPFDREYWIAVSSSIVKIEVRRTNGYALGTGVVIDRERVVTACHVLRSGMAFAVLHAGVRHGAIARVASSDHDICVLQVPQLEAPAVALRPTARLAIGEDVGAIGFSAGATIHFTRGAVDRLHRYDKGMVVQASAAFTSGASGGGLFDADKRLVGILMFRMKGAGAQFFSVPVEWIVENADAGSNGSEDGMSAIPFWERVPERLPYFMRANFLASEERWDELRALLSQWKLDEPSSAEPAFLAGELDRRDGRTALALTEYREAVACDPEHALAWVGLARASMLFGEVGLAREAYARLVPLSAALSGRIARDFPEVLQ